MCNFIAGVAQSGTAPDWKSGSERFPGSNPGTGVFIIYSAKHIFAWAFSKKGQW